MAVIQRRAARVVVIADDDLVLLLEGHDSTTDDDATWWFTVGGGLEPGEDLTSGALRELAEETGRRGVDPGDLQGPIWHRRAAFDFEGDQYEQEEWFFLLRVRTAHGIDDHDWVPLERRSLLGHRWWPLAELRTTAETVYPAGLGDLVSDLLRDGCPPAPLTLAEQRSSPRPASPR